MPAASYSAKPMQATPKPLCLADCLIAVIQAKRDEINRMDFGTIHFTVQHHTLFEMEIAPKYRAAALLDPSGLGKPEQV